MTPDDLYFRTSFRKQLDKIAKRYPKDKGFLNNLLKDVSSSPLSSGVRMKGFDCHIRKINLGFPQHNVSSQKGARILYLVKIALQTKDTQGVIFISIYMKADYNSETKERNYVKEKLREIIREINSET